MINILCKAYFGPSLCVFHPIWVFFFCGGLGGGPKGVGAHNLLMQFSSLCCSKMEISETDLFYIPTIQNDQISNLKHVLDPLYVFINGHLNSTWLTSPPLNLCTYARLKDECPLYVVFTLFGCFFCAGGGGVPRGLGHTTCLCSFPASAAQK